MSLTADSYNMKKFAAQLRDGILDNNPTLVQLLGMCPTLATTTSALNAVGMGISAAVVLTFSNMFISLLRKFIPREIRIAAYIVIISGFVSAIEMLIKAYVPSLDKSLGVFIPLIVVNCIILARAEAFASKNSVLPSIADGLSMGLGFTFALTVIGSIRELFGAGSLFGIKIFGDGYKPILMMIMPSGAFIVLGCVIAAVNKLKSFGKTAPASGGDSDGNLDGVKADPASGARTEVDVNAAAQNKLTENDGNEDNDKGKDKEKGEEKA